MFADWANLRGIFANDNMSAVTAFPNSKIITDEDDTAFDFVKKLAVALLMMLFDGADSAEFPSNLKEAFFLGDLGKTFIHIGPFIVLAFSSIKKILLGGWDFTAVKILEPELSVLFFVFCGL